MSWVVGGWPGQANVVGLNGRFGVLPAEMPTVGDYVSPLLDDVDPGDDATEFVWIVKTLPTSGVVVARDDGGFSHTGAVDGAYVTIAELWTWAPGGPAPVYEGDTIVETIFGSGTNGFAPSRMLSVSVSLIAGSTGVATIYRPTGDAGGSGWVATPAGPLYAAIDEITPDDSDFISTQIAGSAPAYFPIGPIPPGSFRLRVRADTIGAGTTLRVNLLNAFGASLAEVSTPINSARTTYELDFDLAGTATQYSLEVAP